MIKITPRLFLDEKDLEFIFIRSSGPGGQNINKVSSAVQLRFDVLHNISLQDDQKQRLKKLAGRRINHQGILIIEAKRHRSQEQNKQDAIQRLIVLIQRALVKPQKRIPTRATHAAREKRLEYKKRHSALKNSRKKSPLD